MNPPAIYSIGAAYTGIECFVFAADVRYLDYANTKGFGDEGFGADGSLLGLGWRSIFAVALGAEYCPTDCTSLRAGFSWNENPIPNDHTFVNVASPTITKHAGFFGASWDVTCDLTLSVAYMHAFDTSIAGNIVTPLGAVPASSVRTNLSLDSILFGMSVKFGGCPVGVPIGPEAEFIGRAGE